jgi:hypothetical protein
VKIEESLMIQTTRVWRGEVEKIEDPGQTEENLSLKTLHGNAKGGEQSPPFGLLAHCHSVNITA